jgi:hypothetical protein
MTNIVKSPVSTSWAYMTARVDAPPGHVTMQDEQSKRPRNWSKRSLSRRSIANIHLPDEQNVLGDTTCLTTAHRSKVLCRWWQGQNVRPAGWLALARDISCFPSQNLRFFYTYTVHILWTNQAIWAISNCCLSQLQGLPTYNEGLIYPSNQLNFTHFSHLAVKQPLDTICSQQLKCYILWLCYSPNFSEYFAAYLRIFVHLVMQIFNAS